MSKRKKHTFTLSEAAKKKLVLNLPYCMIGLYATKLGQAWRMAEGTNLSEKQGRDGLSAWTHWATHTAMTHFPLYLPVRRSTAQKQSPFSRTS